VSNSLHNATIRRTSFAVAAETLTRVRRARSIACSPRRAEKPECISAAALRPSARATGSVGHSFAMGNFSARYSQIARLSQIVTPPSLSTGTNPAGDPAATMASCVVGWLSRRRWIRVSVNGAPTCLSASHGRMDQVDQTLSPMMSSMDCFSARRRSSRRRYSGRL